jgi:sulfur-oxidizing protein SoxX
MLVCLLLPLTMHAGQVGASMGDTMPAPAGVRPGDPQAGRSIVADRQQGFCLLCHSGPFPEVRQQGNLAPSLAGAGSRWTEAQLRLRITDSRRLKPDSIMPSYGVRDPAPMVAARHRGMPLLSAQQIEDITAFLATLKE